MNISADLKKKLLKFLKTQKNPELLSAYLFCVEQSLKLNPVVFVKNKIVYQTPEDAVQKLESEGKIWRETEIKIGIGKPTVNEDTKRIYICPFTGKVFADNVYANPLDAIYDWLSKCKENTERQAGVPVKRFLVSDDKAVIRNYMQPVKEPIVKTVFSSVISGRLFDSREFIIEEFKKNYLKSMTLVEVQNQNRFQLEDSFLILLQGFLLEEKISAFVEALAEDSAFYNYISKWVDITE